MIESDGQQMEEELPNLQKKWTAKQPDGLTSVRKHGRGRERGDGGGGLLPM